MEAKAGQRRLYHRRFVVIAMMISDREFERTLEGFSSAAQEQMRAERQRHIDEVQLRAQREALHAGKQVTSQPGGQSKAKSGSNDTLNKFAAFIGKKFRAEAETMGKALHEAFAKHEKSIESRFATLRHDYLQKAKSRAAELAREEVRGVVEDALEAHREERVRLQARVDALADEVTRLKLMRS